MTKEEEIKPVCQFCGEPVEIRDKFRIYHGEYVHIDCFVREIGYEPWEKTKRRNTKGNFRTKGKKAKGRELEDKRKYNRFPPGASRKKSKTDMDGNYA